MKETFGQYIRILRTQKGYTLTQLAAKLDLDAANLSKIENGKRGFDQKKLTKLSEIFELDIEEVKDEYVSDKIAQHIYELGCSAELLKVAEEKAEYRRTQKNE
ncbi:helix-turn-helix domain-containing protein [Aquimarina algicola]|uniref:Helix-turn-helix transcriptional regulator n=1 Tax=Aquimarina algicola TaxID=2589995 RepID=A0A504JMK9_9FLAO|nr:helix-turn-helix transcriptional regulator [Aquimarina algicola]TPN87931.1 helix-turn-helix transcriptional regulator [Aquimarina algicola]